MVVVVGVPSVERRLLKYLCCKSNKGIKREGNTHQAEPGAWRYLDMLQNSLDGAFELAQWVKTDALHSIPGSHVKVEGEN